MPFKFHDPPPFGTLTLMSFSLSADDHDAETAQEDDSDIFVSHIDPEDELALKFGGNGVGGWNEAALATFIDKQAQQQQMGGLSRLRTPSDRLSLPLSLLASVVKSLPLEIPGAFDFVKARVAHAKAAKPFLPLQASVEVNRALRARFDGGIRASVQLAEEGSGWPVQASADTTVTTATRDLARYYGLEGPTLPAPDRPAGFPPQSRSDLLAALGDLRHDTGGRLVNLFNDWRMWLAWLDAGNPIICRAPLDLSEQDGDHDSAHAHEASSHFKHVFIIDGYELDESCTGHGIKKVSEDIGKGLRPEHDVPLTVIVRNSWDPTWGQQGHIKVPFAGCRHFADGHGLLLPDRVLFQA